MIDKAVLLADLKPQVLTLEADLRKRAEHEAEFATVLRAEWEQAHKAERTAATYETWLDGEVTQAAVAWVLGTVFLRFCEDNGLIDFPYLAGPGDQLAVAAERQQEFFEHNPHLTDRDWIVAGFEDMSKASPVAAGLFDRTHNPMWRITPSHHAAKDLLAFWRTPGAAETVAHDFTDPGWDTRFLGDLYQDLSEYAKKTYALLQTPEFVEEFILDLTLDPAIDEFGLEPEPSAPAPGSAQDPAGDRPGLRLRPLPARRVPAADRALGTAVPHHGPLGPDHPGPQWPAWRGQEPFRRLDSPLPPTPRRHECRRRQTPRRRPTTSP